MNEEDSVIFAGIMFAFVAIPIGCMILYFFLELIPNWALKIIDWIRQK